MDEGGDNNSKLFHRVANRRRKKKFIDKMKIDDGLIIEDEGMRWGKNGVFHAVVFISRGWEIDIRGVGVESYWRE